ncbi:MAG: PAS domain S-box protein [Rhodomicrobium sp.]
MKPRRAGQLANIVNSSSDAIVGKSLDGIVTSWNEGAVRLFGYAAEEMLGQSIRHLIPPERQDEEDRILRLIKRGNRVESYWTERLHKDGRVLDVSVTISPIYSASGEIIGASKIARDVSDRHRALRALRESEERLASALDAAKLGVFDYDPSTGNIKWDSVIRALWGVPEGEPITYETFEAGVHPDDRAAVREAIAASFDLMGTSRYECEYRVVNRADRCVRWVFAAGNTTFSGGKPSRLVGIAQDITPRKEAQLSQAEREKRDRYFFQLDNALQRSSSARDAIGAACQLTGRELDAAYVSLSEVDAGTAHYTIVNAWRSHGDLEPLPSHGRVSETASRRMGLLHAGEIVTITDVKEDPLVVGDHVTQTHYEELGIRSWIAVPLMRENQPRAVFFVADSRPRQWTERDAAIARSTLDRLWQAVERARAEESLRESEERLRLANEAAGIGTFTVNLEEGAAYYSPELAKMLGFPGVQKARIEHALARVHRDDVEHVQRSFQEAADGRNGGQLKMEFRYVRPGGEIRWMTWIGRTDFRQGPRGAIPFRLVGACLDITDRKGQEEQINLLMSEVNHRAKNMLTLVQAVARQTAASGTADFIRRFDERVQALAASHDLLAKNEWQGIRLDDLVSSQLAHFRDLIGKRIEFSGPRLLISASAAQTIGMAMHELATNAGKYGALANGNGRVGVMWSLGRDESGEKIFVMSWSEHDGPPVTAPARLGFGTTVICRMAETSLNGKVELDFAPSGVSWRLRCPAKEILDDARSKPGGRGHKAPGTNLLKG